MENRKTPVMKSVSTSEAKNNSSAQEHNKKSRSSAEFQAKVTVTSGFQPLKRRGVYVEKKSIKIPINVNPEARASSPKVLARHIRRPDKKRFLANVLQLLSKSTAGTQCSPPNSNDQLKIEKIKTKVKKKREEDEVPFEDSVRSPTVRRKARNWKTKGLNKYVDSEIDSLIVLQSTKQIIQTPSNNSECNLTLNRKAISTHFEPEQTDWTAPYPYPPSDRQDLNTTPAKASHSKNCLISNEEETAVNRNEHNVYNFFVDVLKTTLSACNVKHDSDGRLLYTNSSNVSLVIDEAVAEKLKIQEIKDVESMAIMKEYESKSQYNELDMLPCNSQCYYSVMPHETQECGENFKPEYSKQYKVELTKKKNKQRITSSSFQNRASTFSTSNRSKPVLSKPMYKTTSMPVPPSKKKPKKSKENNIRDFILSIKQDLQFNKEDVYEKPNFYQALKTMAKNKKEQLVNFSTNERPSDDNVCQLKSRKVLSDKSSLKKKPMNSERWTNRVPNSRQPNFSRYNRHAPITIYETSSDESTHSNYSLEVIGYEGQSEFSSPSAVSDY